MKKLTIELRKFWFRMFDKKQYHDYKVSLKEQKYLDRFNVSLKNEYNKIWKAVENEEELNFKHSGHLGDILYALPVIKELSKNKKCNLYLHTNQSEGGNYYKHPSGNIMLSNRSAQMLLPLLESQSYLNKVAVYNDEAIHVNLDLFRKLPISHSFHSERWYFHLTGVHANMSDWYLNVTPHDTIKNKIVVVRTFRSRNPFVDYSFLNSYKEVLFLGTKDEYEDFSKNVPNSEFYDVKDFLEMARIIKSSRFVIANQTFAYAIAEGLKHPRLLEANPDIPVVFPIGNTLGFDFYFQEHFEKLVQKMDEICPK
ncbi:hypothetical protein [Flavobacterium sp.]|uniref:hypothetical protein n=1 Tax=Flavobacterium sp. TaxID=239 RepID=UPI0028BEC725|nr:hypothetical protein [Flavobacterium sp.]